MTTLFCVVTFAAFACADEALHVRIDKVLAEAHPAGQAPIASDADFLRRAYLTLHGSIPTSAQAREFFEGADTDKRAKLIDSLIADPQFDKWMAVRLDVMLMERRAEKYTKEVAWRDWLEECIRTNKPWDKMVAEIVIADGPDEKARPPARWTLEREADQFALTRDASRIFLGRDIACSQCHDHPRIDDYHQRDYAGLQAFFSRTSLFRPAPAKPAMVAETATGDTTYLSVFTKVGGTTLPRLVGEAEIADGSAEWLVAPSAKDKTVRPVPKFSRRAMLAKAFGDGHHPAFRRNIANRLWAIVFGRGIVEPLDLIHSANPPANAPLLDLLTDEIAAMKFDMRAFVRELALTDAFQRGLDLPDAPPARVAASVEKLPSLEKEARRLADDATAAEEAFQAARKATVEALRAAGPLSAEKAKLETVTTARKAAELAAAELKSAEDTVAVKEQELKKLKASAAAADRDDASAEEILKAAATSVKLQSQVDVAAKALAMAQADAVVKKTESDAKAKVLADAEKATAAAREKVDAVLKQAAEHQVALDAAEVRKEAARTKASTSAQLVEELKAIATWRKAAAADRIAQTRLTELQGLAEVRLAAPLAGRFASTSSVPAVSTKRPASGAAKQASQVLAISDEAPNTPVAGKKRGIDDAARDVTKARDAVEAIWGKSFAAMELLPLTPEQLCWSMMQATGQMDAHRIAATREWDAKNKPSAADRADPAKKAVREAAIDGMVKDRVRDQEARFVKLFGGAAGQPQNDFFATPEQALYFENGGMVHQWATTLATRAAALPDTKAVADEIYLSTLTRYPDGGEVADLTKALADHPPEKKTEVLSDLAWALVTSIEFRFMH